MNTPLLLTIQGVNNFRDQGGYALAAGRMKTGRLFRSGHLADITDEGRENLAALNISQVVDLRDDLERNGFPTPLDLGPELSAFPGGLVHADQGAQHNAPRNEDEVREHKKVFYENVPHRFPNAIKAVFDTLAAGNNVLVHCTAGKDRTGVVCAAVTRAIGMPMDTLVTDYLATMAIENQMEPDRVEALDKFYGFDRSDPELYRIRRMIFPELIETSFAVIDRDFGGHDSFLADHCGVDENALTEVRKQLISPS